MPVVVWYLYRNTFFIWSVPPLFAALIASTVVLLSTRRVPVSASLFVLAGALSVTWSLAPGHSLLNVLWETLYLATLATSTWLPSYVLLNGAVLVAGLEQTLVLDLFGLTQYFSGSVHYVAGAQGLLFLPVCLYLSIKEVRPWANALYLVGGGLSLFLTLNSGARAVYLPLILLLPPLLWRLSRSSTSRRQALTVITFPIILALCLNWALPGSPLTKAIGVRALGATVAAFSAETPSPDVSSAQAASAEVASPTTSVSSTVSVEGGISSRLRMWEQAARIGLEHPAGTGAGTFREIVHGFQSYSSIGFSSAHNVFMETFATGGWLRLALLLGLLLPGLVKAWRGERWAFALGAAGIWTTLAFDVTAQFPAVMALAFGAIGTLHDPKTITGPAAPRARGALAFIAGVTALAVVAWWYWPCQGASCAIDRHLGFRPHVRLEMRDLGAGDRRHLAEQAVALNPRSLWAWQELVEATTLGDEKLRLARELAERFPKASSQVYLQWAELALELNRPAEARGAVRTGLENFPPGLTPAGVPLVSRGAQHARWLTRANEILAETASLQ